MKTYTAEEAKENRKKWIEALRSGEYKQGMGVLREEDNKFCCLGVACDISGLGEWKYDLEDSDGINLSYVIEESVKKYSNDGLLPLPVQFWVGLRSNAGDAFESGSLIQINDTGSSFKEVADFIEKEPEGLVI